MQPVMHELADGEYYQDFYIPYDIHVYNILFGEKKKRNVLLIIYPFFIRYVLLPLKVSLKSSLEKYPVQRSMYT